MFDVGKKVFIRTVTFHHVGEIAGPVEDGMLPLKGASWVADSGRFHKAIHDGTLNEVEYVGDAAVSVGTIVDMFPWTHDLPSVSK